MKHQWVWITAFLAANPAHGQSSVTLYRLIDQGLNYTSNAQGKAAYQMKSGDVTGSRWGLKGSEDLGGGYRAVLQLDGGFNASSGTPGQGGREFGRQAYVGISSDRYGTVTLGRQYDPTTDPNGYAAPTVADNWGGDVGAHPFDNDNSDWDFRLNNAVKYVSPSYRGLIVEGMYAFSNQAGGFSNNSAWSAALNYQNGGLTLAASYLKLNNPGAGTTGAEAIDTLFSASSEQNYGVSVTYRFSSNLAAFMYSHVDVYNPTANSYFTSNAGPDGGTWNSWKFDKLEINDQYFFRSNFWLGCGYTFTDARLASSVGGFIPRWQQVTLMLDYDVTRQTSLYMQGEAQHVVSAHTGTDFDYADNPAAAAMSSGENQLIYRIDVVHHF
ncbi:MAG: porin [Paraburkholderia sp.]